jgi:hypothetical protein
MLMIGGATLRAAVVGPSVLALGSFIFLFLQVALDFTGSVGLAIASLVLVLNLSGFGFLKWFWSASRRSADCDFVLNLGHGEMTQWSHPLVHYALASRPAPFVLGIASGILEILWRKPDRYEFMAVGGLLAMTISLDHQAFFSLLLYILVHFALLAVTERKKSAKLRENVRAAALVFVIVAVIPFVNLRKRALDLEWFQWKPFWAELENQGYFFPPIVLWVKNTGLFALVLLFSAFALDGKQRMIAAPAILTFMFGNFVMTHTYDRFTFHYLFPTWGLVGTLSFIATLAKWVEYVKNEELKGAVLAVAIVLWASSSVSGLMCVYKTWGKRAEAWTEAEEQVANFIVKHTGKSDVFLTLEEPFEPVSTLAGRRILLSSDKTMWFLGYNWYLYRDELSKIRRDPTSGILPKVKWALENTRKKGEKLKQPDMTQAWTFVFGYESYQLYNRTASLD